MLRDDRHLADFGPFTFDLTANVLLRGEDQVHLPPMALAILRYLIEHRERYLPMAELQQKFWEDATAATAQSIADSIYQQIRLIRDELGDSKQQPFIETKYKRGYRFIIPVTERTDWAASEVPAASASDAPAVPETRAENTKAEPVISVPEPAFGGKGRYLQIGVVAVSLAVAGVALAIWRSPRGEAKVKRSTQLTNDGKGKVAPLLTNGERIFFAEVTDGSNRLVSIPVSGGEPTPVNLPLRHIRLEDISRDGSTLLLQSDGQGRNGKLWTYGISSQSLRPLATGWKDAAWSPDGRALAATDAQGTSIQILRGRASSKTELPGRPLWLEWAPDSRKLRFSLSDFRYESSSLWEIAQGSGHPRKLESFSEGQKYVSGGSWSRDGKYFFYEAGNGRQLDIWVCRENAGFFHFGATKPSRVTTGEPGSWSSPIPSPDPSTLFVLNDQVRLELVRFDVNTGLWKPEWNGRSAFGLDYSRDAQWVAYTYSPDHTIWKAKPDGSGRVKLTYTDTVLEAHQPHWSPDGSHIAFMGKNRRGQWRVFQVPSNGGPAEELLSIGESWGVPTWSQDGRFLCFGERLSAKPRAEMALYLLDVTDRRVSEMPGTKGLWNSRWSPDGRYIAAPTTDSQAIRVVRWPGSHWKELIRMKYVDNVTWSVDSRYIQFDGEDENDHYWLFRLSIPDGRLERIADLATFPWDENWWGVAQDGAPLGLRASFSSEIYALRCTLP